MGQTFASGTVVADRFRVKRLLGAGGYGEVYVAQQLSMDRSVALKVLRRQLSSQDVALGRFKNEARFACQLRHPNTVIYYDFGEDTEHNVYWLTMEYLEGRSLAQRLRTDGTISFWEAADIVEGIAGSLHEAHEFGLIHRDIKPGNVMLVSRAGNDHYVKVIDFGIAKAISGRGPGVIQSLTATGTVLGSPAYMAPEQIRRTIAPLGPYTDVYALAVMTYRLLSGILPFRGATPIEVAMAHLTSPPPRLSALGVKDVPSGLEELLLASLSKMPTGRPQSAMEFAARFRAAVEPPQLLAHQKTTALVNMAAVIARDSGAAQPARPGPAAPPEELANTPAPNAAPSEDPSDEPRESTLTMPELSVPTTALRPKQWSGRHKVQMFLALTIIILGAAVIAGVLTIANAEQATADRVEAGESSQH